MGKAAFFTAATAAALLAGCVGRETKTSGPDGVTETAWYRGIGLDWLDKKLFGEESLVYDGRGGYVGGGGIHSPSSGGASGGGGVGIYPRAKSQK